MIRFTAALTLMTAVAMVAGQSPAKKILVAHRGASAYAPEHTLEAYSLAITQGADFVEQDLAVTRDGVLVCIHDLTLERTTNVEEVFPDRVVTSTDGRRWPVNDFTLAEIRRLDAGSWFGAKFAGAGWRPIRRRPSSSSPSTNRRCGAWHRPTPAVVARAHAAGLTVTPWTFRSGSTGAFRSVRGEMAHFLDTLGVDALFTNNPDQFPRR